MKHTTFTFCAIVCALFAGCGTGAPDRVPVSGTVKVDGAPLAKGSIVFVPTGATEGPKSGGPIENGQYSIPEELGPVLGTVRVEIFAEQDLGFALDDAEEVVKHAAPGEVIPPNPIPSEYNQQSKLVRETVPGSQNTFDFEIVTNVETEDESQN